jgi:tRNA nucleotidyltransferase/poly(A) polymerase
MCLRLAVAPETFELCKTICAKGELRELSRERICSELRKLLESPNASQGLATLCEMGALDSLSLGWAARLGEHALAATETAAKTQLPEWCMVRLACCQSLGAKESEAFLTEFRFPSDTIRWASRLGMFQQWAQGSALDPVSSAMELERSGAPKFSEADRAAFGACASLELRALGAAPEAIASAMAALSASKAIADCDLASALAGPKKDIPAAVRQAKADAFAMAWRAASEQSSPRGPRP